MLDINNIIKEIIVRLQPINPFSLILFGSYAYGNPNNESDIDLYVVTRDNFIPSSFREKKEITRKISRALMDIRLEVGIDLMVHTKPMNKKFYSINSLFAQEIKEKGIPLI